jgi:hypothetical protein
MVLDTNIYLHMPPSAYEGRRFLVLLEPMLAPSETNARIYGIRLRHRGLARGPARRQRADGPDPAHLPSLHHRAAGVLTGERGGAPVSLLKPVQDAPLEFIYKSDARRC